MLFYIFINHLYSRFRCRHTTNTRPFPSCPKPLVLKRRQMIYKNIKQQRQKQLDFSLYFERTSWLVLHLIKFVWYLLHNSTGKGTKGRTIIFLTGGGEVGKFSHAKIFLYAAPAANRFLCVFLRLPANTFLIAYSNLLNYVIGVLIIGYS